MEVSYTSTPPATIVSCSVVSLPVPDEHICQDYQNYTALVLPRNLYKLEDISANIYLSLAVGQFQVSKLPSNMFHNVQGFSHTCFTTLSTKVVLKMLVTKWYILMGYQ